MDTNDRTYTMRQLLGENITIVIPDMQRDYCWGSDYAGGKATTFVRWLLTLYSSGRMGTLGLLYGYEMPAGSSHIHIIDGQQRLTTLYLLIGMLYRRTPRMDLRRMLISDFELIDDREPRLLYEERAEAMYFMSELVTHFFLNRDGRLSQLEKSAWYCSTYSTDPTARSFVGALRKIDEVLESVCNTDGWDFDDFADFVTDKLTFYYHDTGERARAEEMFVIINTTGEPLTLPQQIKAALPHTPENLDRWEEMERWAWRHRPHRGASDERLTSLIRLWIKYSRIDIHNVAQELSRLYMFSLCYRTLCECEPSMIEADSENPADMFVVLPVVRYIEKWGLTSADKVRIKEFTDLLRNVTRYQRVSPQGSDMESACRMIDRMTSSDVTSLLNIPESVAPKILSDEEKTKLRVLADNPTDRYRVEQMLRKGERHPLLNGRLQKVISWCIDRTAHQVDTGRLGRYIDMIYKIWGTEIDCRDDLDILRRAMLTLRYNGYPMPRRADATLSMCWHEYEWQRLMTLSPGVIRQIIDRVAEKGLRPADTLSRMIGKFDDRSFPYYFLISSASQMSACMHRSLLRYCKKFIGYYQSGDDKAKPMIHWLIDGHKVKLDTGRWTVMRPYGTRCLYTDHRWLNVSVDIHYQSNDSGRDEGYRIDVFSRNDTPQREPFDLRILLSRTGRRFGFDKRIRKFYLHLHDSASAISVLHSILSGC